MTGNPFTNTGTQNAQLSHPFEKAACRPCDGPKSSRSVGARARFLLSLPLLLTFLPMPMVKAESFLNAASADAAATYHKGNTQFSRERLSDQSFNVGGQGGTNGFLQAVVFPFQLPDFGSVEQPFENAQFIFRLTNKERVSDLNVDLYGLPSRTGSAVLPASTSATNRGDFFMGGFQGGPSDDNAVGVVKIQDNLLVPATSTGEITTFFSGNAQLADYLNAAYDGGNGAGRWVFLRLSTDSRAAGASRYSVSTADHPTPEYRPRIRYNFESGPEELYTQTGSDPTFQELIDSGVIEPGVSFGSGPVLSSQITVNKPLLEQQTGPTGPVVQPIRIHTQVNSSIRRSNFADFTRWYQEDDGVQVMRLFQGEQNVRSGIGPDGSPGRIEAFFPHFTVSDGTWSVWEGTYTIVEPLGSNIFQLFHEGGQLWAFHLRMTSAGAITFNRRREIAGLPTRITIASDMAGRSISFRVRANGSQYEIFKKIPGEDPDWTLVTAGSYTPAVNNRISFRWGMYVGSQAGQSVPKDGLLFVSGVTRTTSTAPAVGPVTPPPPPVTYYWDNNGAAAGFGNAGGVWSETTTGNATQGWTTDASGGTVPEDVEIYALDPVFFGTNTSGRGLGTGTITIAEPVVCADLTFGSQSGNLILDGGEIFQGANSVIKVAGTGTTHTIHSELSGFGTRTIGGGGTLELSGPNSFVGPLTIGDNTSNNLRVRFNTITDVGGGPSSLGAPIGDADGIIQLGSVSRRATLEFTNATAAQSTDRRIRIGSNANGSGGATILNNNPNPEHALTFTHSSFNPAATGISNTNRVLNLGGSNTGSNTIGGAIVDNIGTSGGKVSLVKSDTGTWVLNGPNTYSGSTSVNEGTLALVGASFTSRITVAAGARLGFTPGSPVTSTSSLNLTNGAVRLIGTVEGDADVLLMTATGGITGTPVLDPPVPGYELQVQNDGTELVLAHLDDSSSFAIWSGGAAPDADSNGDGVPNAIAWALGATSPLSNARNLLPTWDPTSDPDYLVFTFDRSDAVAADPHTDLTVESSSDLVTWTTAVHDGDSVIIEVTDATPADTVVVKWKRPTLAPMPPLFTRLKVTID